MASRSMIAAVMAAAVVTVGCSDNRPPAGTFDLGSSETEQYPTAYMARVVADPPGDDVAPNGGEHVIIRNNAEIRIDMGGWWIEVGDARLPLGIGRQIDVDAELRVHPGHGDTGDDAVFVGLDQEVLADDGALLILRDSAGSEVARFAYGGAD